MHTNHPETMLEFSSERLDCFELKVFQPNVTKSLALPNHRLGRSLFKCVSLLSVQKWQWWNLGFLSTLFLYNLCWKIVCAKDENGKNIYNIPRCWKTCDKGEKMWESHIVVILIKNIIKLWDVDPVINLHIGIWVHQTENSQLVKYQTSTKGASAPSAFNGSLSLRLKVLR